MWPLVLSMRKNITSDELHQLVWNQVERFVKPDSEWNRDNLPYCIRIDKQCHCERTKKPPIEEIPGQLVEIKEKESIVVDWSAEGVKTGFDEIAFKRTEDHESMTSCDEELVRVVHNERIAGVRPPTRHHGGIGEWFVVATSDEFGRCGKYLPMRKQGMGELFEQITEQEFFTPRIVVNEVAVVDLEMGTTCWRCDAKLCPKCGSTAHDDTDESKEGESCGAKHDFRLLGMVSSRNDWVQCPKCQHVLERTQGCDHMTCPCGAQFCFVCRAMPHCGSKCKK